MSMADGSMGQVRAWSSKGPKQQHRGSVPGSCWVLHRCGYEHESPLLFPTLRCAHNDSMRFDCQPLPAARILPQGCCGGYTPLDQPFILLRWHWHLLAY